MAESVEIAPRLGDLRQRGLRPHLRLQPQMEILTEIGTGRDHIRGPLFLPR
jgi:hypothetical protein